jgi:hypothetical protein
MTKHSAHILLQKRQRSNALLLGIFPVSDPARTRHREFTHARPVWIKHVCSCLSADPNPCESGFMLYIGEFWCKLGICVGPDQNKAGRGLEASRRPSVEHWNYSLYTHSSQDLLSL